LWITKFFRLAVPFERNSNFFSGKSGFRFLAFLLRPASARPALAGRFKTENFSIPFKKKKWAREIKKEWGKFQFWESSLFSERAGRRKRGFGAEKRQRQRNSFYISGRP